MSTKYGPRQGHAPIPMRRVQGYAELSQPGDFYWSKGSEEVRRLYVAVPTANLRSGWVAIAPVVPEEGSTYTGTTWDFSGTDDKPTLTPSHGVCNHWHGFITDGFLVEV